MTFVRAPVSDLLAEPDPKSERVSQLLCFTPCEILGERGDFVYVRGPDGYRGWIRKSHLSEGKLPEPNYKVSEPIVPVRERHNGRIIFHLSLDTRFVGETSTRGIEIRLPTGIVGLLPKEAVRPVSWRGSLGDLIATGLRLCGIPYLWGGTSAFGFDCSGLIQRLIHFIFNLWLPRDSEDQARVGKPVESSTKFRPGDLLFFPGHVALWLGQGRILHASAREGMVAISPFASLAHGFRGARRLSDLLKR